MSEQVFHKKSAHGAPAGGIQWEAAGLRWLAEAQESGGARIVKVFDVGPDFIDIERVRSVTPTIAAAEDFGRALAATHRAGADAFGSPPDGWTGDGFFGPAEHLLPLPLRPTARWGEFYADQRVRHTYELGARTGVFDKDDGVLFDAVGDRLRSGEWDDDAPPARTHGDLWSGNVMWTDEGVVLIDPAACGGHAEGDLAMLQLFGAPQLKRIIAAYDEVSPLADGWQSRVGLHQLFPVMMHAVLFGGGYVSEALSIARRYA